MRTFLGVPILVGSVPFGNLYLTEKKGGGQFSEHRQLSRLFAKPQRAHGHGGKRLRFG